jgi:hypothetical protein
MLASIAPDLPVLLRVQVVYLGLEAGQFRLLLQLLCVRQDLAAAHFGTVPETIRRCVRIYVRLPSLKARHEANKAAVVPGTLQYTLSTSSAHVGCCKHNALCVGSASWEKARTGMTQPSALMLARDKCK